MQTVNWLALQPTPAESEALQAQLLKPVPVRKACQLLAEITLQTCPWDGRADLIPFFHPSQTYQKDDWVALPIPDKQKIRPLVWQIAQVRQAEQAANPVQGKFQVITLDLYGRSIQVAAGIRLARFIEPDLSAYTPEDRAWLAEWVGNTFNLPLQETIKKLIQRGDVQGQIVNEAFIPEKVFHLAPEQLRPFFERLSMLRPWVSIDELIRAIPELSRLKPETARVLARAALDETPYRSLGGDRWTTAALYTQLNREVPRGLPTPRIRSRLGIWTEQDQQDFAGYGRKSLPVAARRAVVELDQTDAAPATPAGPWQPPASPIRLPTLNYLHITQAYFPADHIIHAFAPETRLVFVQFIEDEPLPFLLDRDTGLLKALNPEALRAKILESGIPAGTHLWLEYLGAEKYRVAPRPLPFERSVPCKLAYIENGELRIEQTEIPMRYEGDPSVFKADMRFSDIEALFAEASRVNLSVRDAIIFAIQELCAADPRNRAHKTDIFNAVFLKRMCSPNSVSLLLYTQPCFEQVGNGYFRYNPNIPPVIQAETTKKSAPPAGKLRKKQPVDVFHLKPALHPAAIPAPEPAVEQAPVRVLVDEPQPAHLPEPVGLISEPAETVSRPYEPVIPPEEPIQPEPIALLEANQLLVDAIFTSPEPGPIPESITRAEIAPTENFPAVPEEIHQNENLVPIDFPVSELVNNPAPTIDAHLIEVFSPVVSAPRIEENPIPAMPVQPDPAVSARPRLHRRILNAIYQWLRKLLGVRHD